MKIRKMSIDVSAAEICYYIFFSFLLFAKGIGLYDGQMAFKAFLALAVAAWMGKMWLTEYTARELTGVVLLLTAGGIAYLVSGEKGALLYIFMVTGLKNVPVKRVFTVGAVIWSIAYMGMTWMNALHILEGPFKVHEKLGMGMVIRWGLGYSHPNVLHISYLVLVMFLVYVLGEKHNWKTAAVFMLGNIGVYIYSISSTGIITTTFYLVLSLYWRYRKKWSRLEQIGIQSVMPVCILFSLMAPFLLKGVWFDRLNDLMNTRLNLAKYFLSLQRPTLFGTKLSEIITSQLTMDNSYVFAFVTYGILLFLIIFGAYLALIRTYCKEQKGTELCIILACLVAGIMEPFLFNTAFKNISLLFMKDLLFKEGDTRQIRFPGAISKNFTIPVIIIEKAKGNKKLALSLFILGCMIGGSGYLHFCGNPARIIVPRSACDVGVLQRTEESLEKIYLSSDEAVLAKEDKVYGYVDGQTEMLVYSGGIAKMEYLRDLLCYSVTGGVLLIIVYMALVYKVPIAGERNANTDCK